MTEISTDTDTRGPLAGVPKAIFVLVAALLVTSAIGFYPAYFSQFPEFYGSGWEVHLHLFTIFAWLALLATQAWLGATGRIELHRFLGRCSYFLVPVIVVGFVLVARFGQTRQPNPALIGAAFFDGGLFLLFYVLAVARRRNTDHHSRYMLLTAVALINAPLGRAVAPQVSVPLELLVILTLLVVAKVRGPFSWAPSPTSCSWASSWWRIHRLRSVRWRSSLRRCWWPSAGAALGYCLPSIARGTCSLA